MAYQSNSGYRDDRAGIHTTRKAASQSLPSSGTVATKADGAFSAAPGDVAVSQRFPTVITYIEENLHSALELDGLAQKANLSKFHFCRTFKRHTGLNPMKYVAALRIDRAKELLKQDGISVSSIASQVGFRDLSNFIRQFKKVTGVTPSRYR